MRHARGPQPLDAAREHAEPAAALLALLEEQLHADADAEHAAGRRRRARAAPSARPRRASPRAALAALPTPAITASGALANGGRVAVTTRLRTGARERRADAAQVAGAVVGQYDFTARPSSTAATPPREHASRSARPSALNAASATWWSSSPAASTCSVSPAWIAKRSSACGSSVSASPPTRSPVKASATSACGRRTRSTAAVARASSIGTVAEP